MHGQPDWAVAVVRGRIDPAALGMHSSAIRRIVGCSTKGCRRCSQRGQRVLIDVRVVRVVALEWG